MQHREQAQPFYGWKLVAALFAIYLINTGFPYYGGTVLNAYMAEELGFSRSELGIGYSAFVLAFGLFSPLSGMLVNLWGIRTSISLGGILLMLTSLAMATLVTQAWHYYAVFGLACGIGFSLGGVIPVQSGVTYWFKRKKPLAMSIVLCAAGVGSMISIPILNGIVETLGNGWRTAWYLVAAFSLLAALISLLWVKNKPEDIGQSPDGDTVSLAGDDSAPGGKTAANAGAVYHTDETWTAHQAIRTKAACIIVFAASAYSMVFSMCIGHGVVHLRDNGIDPTIAATSVGLLVMASIIGRLGCGVAGSRIEPRYTWCAGLLLMTLGILILSTATSNWEVYAYAVAIGVGFGASYVSVATIIGNYYGTESFAPILGILTTITCIAGASSPALAGVIYDTAGSYSLAFNALLGIALAGSLSVPFATPPRQSVA